MELTTSAQADGVTYTLSVYGITDRYGLPIRVAHTVAFTGTAATLNVRAIVHNRPSAINDEGVLDLNVFLAPGLAITDPENETRLQGILDRIEAELARQDRDWEATMAKLRQFAEDDVNLANGEGFLDALARKSLGGLHRTEAFAGQVALQQGLAVDVFA